MINNESLNNFIQMRLKGHSMESVLEEMEERLNLLKLRGGSTDPLVLALHGAALTLPLTPDELDPDPEILARLEQWTEPARVMGQKLKDDINASSFKFSHIKNGSSYEYSTKKWMAGILRLARWRSGATAWPGNMGKVHGSSDALEISRHILKRGITPGLSDYAALSTWRSQTGTIHAEDRVAQAQLIRSRLEAQSPRAQEWAERLRQEWPGQTNNVPRIIITRAGDVALALMPADISLAYRSGALNQGEPQPSPELQAQLSELITQSERSPQAAGIHVVCGNQPLTIPQTPAEQVTFLNWLRERAGQDQATLNILLECVQPDNTSPEALLDWAALTNPALNTNAPATQLIMGLLTKLRYRTGIVNADKRAYQARILQISLKMLMAGTLQLPRQIETTETTGVMSELDHCEEGELITLAEVVVRRNEIYAWKHAQAGLSRPMNSAHHQRWTPMGEEEIAQRACEFKALMEKEIQRVKDSWKQFAATRSARSA